MNPQFPQATTTVGIDILLSDDNIPEFACFTEISDSPMMVNVDEWHLGQGWSTPLSFKALVISLYLSGYILFLVFICLHRTAAIRGKRDLQQPISINL